MSENHEDSEACDEQAGMVDFCSAYAQQARERALAVRTVIIHIAYVIEVQYPDTRQTDSDTAPYYFGSECLCLEVKASECAQQTEEEKDAQIAQAHIAVTMLAEGIGDGADDGEKA